ncbi:mannitol dehydrogenase family protein [Mycolicibacterium thermoresistibile]|uniref:Mannitol 2-dehydrogenase n=2 Tax=Mycolicibacterium thermoresistibile TaxID=1797 RepID=G7CH03_MYCT3|nr:mannitol dehydrogenase family protein [Mycolicibacterium thermoresistibile]EHI12113.1 mannitol 2-dehydrogenase [Mycolicibacterium thermoresistibile ATCC 19527]MCV7191169.1 mannitol dehydrogenase family protein [Mycolicibacterium thermoresistibile]GAT15479.1 mannitol 2-dehydrogenase [Mycolicibacterium thermoresistibile]SNW16970.1 mannitol dehydrogenase [Mycolicibacterium thermoresistibile]
MKLNAANLSALSIPTPGYDRGQVRVGIVHFGVGGFHRAHQAMYLDRLLNDGLAGEWGICGVGVLPNDRRMQEALSRQDHLYTLMLAHPDGTREPRVIGSIVDFRYAPDDPEGVIELLADPAVRIISLTITEGGYNLRDSDAGFDIDNPAVQRDLTGDGPPATVFGLVAAGLARRRERGLPSPTIVSCDNIVENGDVARRVFTSYAELADPGLAQWMREHTRFPNSMVDRITPVTTPEVIDTLATDFDVEDSWPVVAEPFCMWVLEDDFADGRPPWERAGVKLVDDVRPYEAMKLRLLNAGHQSLCYFAYLSGYRLVHEAAQDPLFAEFLSRYMDSEAMPTLQPVPGLHEFKDQLIPRFANAHVRDTIARLCAESSDRIPKWLLPVIRDNLASGGPVRLAAATVASWARYAEGVDEQGEPIDVVDRLADTLIPIARSQRDNPPAFIENRAIFGDLVDQPRFVEAYRWALESLHRVGARATLEALLRERS